MDRLKFLQQLIDGNIYDYSKDAKTNDIQGMALSEPQALPEKRNVVNSPLRMDFEPEGITADLAQPANIKPELPFAFKNKPIVLPKDEPTQSTQPVKPEGPSPEEQLASLNSTPDLSIKDAADRKDDLSRNALWLDAANTMANAISRTAPNDVTKGLRDYSSNILKDAETIKDSKEKSERLDMDKRSKFLDEKKAIFELGDKQKENDPNSEVSKAFREYAKSYISQSGLNIKLDDKLSMADLQKQMGIIGNVVS